MTNNSAISVSILGRKLYDQIAQFITELLNLLLIGKVPCNTNQITGFNMLTSLQICSPVIKSKVSNLTISRKCNNDTSLSSSANDTL